MILTNTQIREIHVHREVDKLLSAGESGKVLLIYPTNRKIRQLKKNVIDISPGRTVSAINLHTLTTLSNTLLGPSKKYRELSEAAAGVFIKKSAAKVQLKYFNNYGDSLPPGTLDRIKNVISKYKESGITPEILISETDSLSHAEKLKALDISEIYKEYLGFCSAANALELGDVYRELVNMDVKEFHRNFSQAFPGIDLILVSGFNEFTSPERQILQRIISINNIRMFIEFDNYNFNPQIFSELEKTVELLESIGFTQITDLAEEDYNPFTKHIRSNLFRIKYSLAKKDFLNGVKIIRAFDREREVELISKEVKSLLIKEKVDPSRICVAFNLIDNYSNLVRFSFRQNGIPFNLTDRTPLSDTYPVSAVLNFLEIAEDDFYYKNIARAFQSGFISLPGIDIPNIVSVGAKLKVVKGFSNWKNSFRRALENSGSFEDSGFRKSDLIGIEKALNDIEALNTLLSPFKKRLTITEFLNRFMKLIKKLNVPELIVDNPSDEDEKNIKAFTMFLDTVEEIFELLREEYPHDTAFGLGFFLDNIRTACRQGRFNVKEKTGYGVLVTTPNEIRGLQFDYIILGGLVDGDLPTRYSPEIFFAECYAKKEYEHVLGERYLYYQVLSAWSKGLVLTMPANDKDRELSESTFVKELLKTIEAEELTGDDYKNLIYSDEELQVKYSSFVSSVDSANLPEEIKKLLQPDLIRKRDADKLRSADPNTESIYNGFINADKEINEEQSELFSDGEAPTNLMEQFFGREYSSSELEVYAKCPFKYFLERVLKVDTQPEPTEEMEAFELGSLLHTILYEFYTEVRESDIVLKNCSDKVFKDSVNMIFGIAEKHISNSAFNSPLVFYDIEKLTGLNGNRKQSILYKFLESERDSQDGSTPKYFEVNFGHMYRDQFDHELNSDEPVEINGVKIKGKIDRIEINETETGYNITDYKLGFNKPAIDDLMSGISLQLPLYMLCAKALLKYKFGSELEPVFIYLFSLKFNSKEFGKNQIKYGRGKFDHQEFNEELMKATSENIKLFVENIMSGNFPLTDLQDRENKVCRYCDFKSVCRVGDLL